MIARKVGWLNEQEVTTLTWSCRAAQKNALKRNCATPKHPAAMMPVRVCNDDDTMEDTRNQGVGATHMKKVIHRSLQP